ncbi:hypothetical protein [Acidovorax sp. CF316]|uniref:hypothetical protein n=1 Tax=Acidovorax sp. CF316 TaxID=1144317 RepID=UPI0002EA3003|nr:hypothetical protein [Acidovorax sp. CF316]
MARDNALLPPASPAAQARRVLALTAQAWGVAPDSPAALARRAPHGHVRTRVLRRTEAQVAAAAQAARASLAASLPRPLLAHSW